MTPTLSTRVSQLLVLALCANLGAAAPLAAAGCSGKLVAPDTLPISDMAGSSVTLVMPGEYTYLPLDNPSGSVLLAAGTEVKAKCTCDGTGKCELKTTDNDDSMTEYDCLQNTCTGDCTLHISTGDLSPSSNAVILGPDGGVIITLGQDTFAGPN